MRRIIFVTRATIYCSASARSGQRVMSGESKGREAEADSGLFADAVGIELDDVSGSKANAKGSDDSALDETDTANVKKELLPTYEVVVPYKPFGFYFAPGSNRITMVDEEGDAGIIRVPSVVIKVNDTEVGEADFEEVYKRTPTPLTLTLSAEAGGAVEADTVDGSAMLSLLMVCRILWY